MSQVAAIQLLHLWQLYVLVQWPQLCYKFSHYHRVRSSFWSEWCCSATTTDPWWTQWMMLLVLPHSMMTTSVQDAYTGLCQRSSSGECCFSELILHQCILCWYLLQCLLFLLSGSDMATIVGSTIGCAPLQHFGVYLWQAYLPPCVGLWPMPVVHWVAAAYIAFSRECLRILNQLSSRHSISMVGHTALRSAESPDPSAFPIWWGGVFSFRLGSTQWHNWFWICCGHYVWWVWCGSLVSSWWIDLYLVGRAVFFCSSTHLPWIHGQGVNTNSLPNLNQGIRIIPF